MRIKVFNISIKEKSLSQIVGSLGLLFKVSNPLTLTFYFNTLAISSLLFIDKSFYLSFAEQENIISTNGTILWFAYYLLFCLGCLQISNKPKYFVPIVNYSDKINENNLLLKLAITCFVLALIGYGIWFKDVFLNLGSYVTNAMNIDLFSTKNVLQKNMISGITTMTQFGVVSVIFFMILYCRTMDKKYLRYIYILLFLSIIRAFLFSERLAFLEIIVPQIFIYIRFFPKLIKKLLLYGVILFIIIWASELFRSYKADRFSDNYTAIEFLFYRLFFYSATSVNNFMLVIKQNYPYDFLPTFLEPFYKILKIPQSPEGNWPNLLNRYLSLEFNNPSGWGEIHFNFGYGGLVFSYFLGSYCRSIYSQYCQGEIKGLIIYPFLMTFILQSPRIFYIISTRTLYILLVFIIFFIINKKKTLRGNPQ